MQHIAGSSLRSTRTACFAFRTMPSPPPPPAAGVGGGPRRASCRASRPVSRAAGADGAAGTASAAGVERLVSVLRIDRHSGSQELLGAFPPGIGSWDMAAELNPTTQVVYAVLTNYSKQVVTVPRMAKIHSPPTNPELTQTP